MRPKAASAPEGQDLNISTARQTTPSGNGNADIDRSSSDSAVDSAIRPLPQTAKGWSKIYNGYADGSADHYGDEHSVMKRRQESNRDSMEGRQPRFARELRPTSSESAIDVRNSTLDFQKTLRLHEAESLRKVLQAMESFEEDTPPSVQEGPRTALRNCSVA